MTSVLVLNKISEEYDCVSLENAFKSNTTFFTKCIFDSIEVDDNNPNYHCDESNYIRYGNEVILGCKNTTFNEKVSKINSYAFNSLKNCTFEIPSTIESIDANAFGDNYSLTLNVDFESKPSGWNDLWASGKTSEINWKK